MEESPVKGRNLAGIVKLALIALLPGLVGAADFGFSVIIRAGSPAAGTFELGIGPLANNTAVTGQLAPYYANNTPQRFEIGYTRGTNTAFARFYNNGASFTEVRYTPLWSEAPGTLDWLVPANALFVRALPRTVRTAVTAADMSFGGPISILQPLSTTTIAASQLRDNVRTPVTTPVRFTSSTSGSWMLAGTLQFLNLSAYVPSGASGQQLSMEFSIEATRISSVPEPSSALLALSGILMLGIVRLASAHKAVRQR